MRYLTIDEVLVIYDYVMNEWGGGLGIRDIGALESAIAQPRATFGGTELYPTLIEKAAALGFSLIQNHPFVDGNKRTGHAAMELFLVLNKHEINATVDEQYEVILKVAAGELKREELTSWLRKHVQAIG
jgi:death-on-curing protein